MPTSRVNSAHSTRDGHLQLRPARRGRGKTSATSKSEESTKPTQEDFPGPKLAFLTTTGPPSERSQESRYVVRSHAMQAFLHEKNGEGKTRARPDSDLEEKSIGDLKGRFKLTTWSRKSKTKTGQDAESSLKKSAERLNLQSTSHHVSGHERPQFTQNQIIRDTLDGYSLLPMPLRAHTKRFLYHYNTSFTMNSSALNPEGTWISFAVTDVAVLHSTMAIVAWHFDQLLGIEESSDTLQQKGQAIQIVNERLNDNEEQVNDGIVGAVAVLANFETMNGTESNSRIHMAGLRRMVELRGGLLGFEENKVLQRVLTWSDVLYSSTWDCKPRFPLLPDPFDLDDPISNLDRFSSTHNLNFVPLHAEWFPSTPALLPILESIRRISKALASPNLGRSDRSAISNRIYRSEHQLLALHESEPNSPEYQAETGYEDNLEKIKAVDLSEPFRFAALLYLRIAIRELPSTARMHYPLVSRVRSNLEKASEAIVRSFASNQSAELLAWIAFMGAAAASDKEDRTYFVGLLAAVCGALEVDGRIGMQRRLEGICWREGICDGYFAAVWREMEWFLLGGRAVLEL